jgi:hypothetical protein
MRIEAVVNPESSWFFNHVSSANPITSWRRTRWSGTGPGPICQPGVQRRCANSTLGKEIIQ